MLLKRFPSESEEIIERFLKLEQEMTLDELLRKSCSYGVIEYVKKYLDMGANPNGVPKEDMPFHYTDIPIFISLSGDEDYNFEIAEYLIERGADINIIKGFATYMVSVDQGKFFDLHDGWNNPKFEEKRAKFLVEHGANINELDLDGETSFTCCIIDGICILEMIPYLISLGADINMKNASGKTPLDLAIEYKATPSEKAYYNDLIQLLRDYGAKTSEELDKGI